LLAPSIESQLWYALFRLETVPSTHEFVSLPSVDNDDVGVFILSMVVTSDNASRLDDAGRPAELKIGCICRSVVAGRSA
jgi:hypothetical protein